MNDDQRGPCRKIELTLFRAFKHGRLSTREECTEMSRLFAQEMDAYIRAATEAEIRTVQRYVAEKLRRIAQKAR